ncbi:ABC transporter substrate-binding protein [Histophilus somni]|nr:ABC transporter substrate-binding protein [Histophilus somni]
MLAKKIFILCTLFYGLLFSLPSFSAPKIPKILTSNGLIYCTNASSFSFNPQTADAGTSMNIVTEQIYNKLFEIKNHSATLEPVLAKSYSISPDGKIITINLRKGVKFHHTDWFKPSRDFNADDVLFSFNRILGQNIALPELDQNTLHYKNPQYKVYHEQRKKVHFPYFDSIKLNEKIQEVKAINPYQVQIILFKPDASVLSHLASQYAIIFSQEYALQLNADDNLVQLDNLPVGTGPYQVKDYFRNQYVRLVHNPNYWQKNVNLENVIIDLSTNRSGRLIKFFNNECHIASYPELSQLGLLRHNDEKYYIKSIEGMNLSYIAFNFQKTLMQDLEIRRHIAHAINRQRIINLIYHNTASVANNIIPSISWGAVVNTTDFAYDYNVKKAKEYFAGKNINLDMWVINEEQVYNPSPIKMAELIKADLIKVGVNVNIRNVTRTYLMKQLQEQTEDYDIILTGWLAGNLDPDSFMRPILSCGTQNEITNFSNWCHAPFEHALDQALAASNLRERAKYYNIAQEIILSEIPILPIANVKRVLLANAKVQGIELTPFGNINFSKLSFKK